MNYRDLSLKIKVDLKLIAPLYRGDAIATGTLQRTRTFHIYAMDARFEQARGSVRTRENPHMIISLIIVIFLPALELN